MLEFERGPEIRLKAGLGTTDADLDWDGFEEGDQVEYSKDTIPVTWHSSRSIIVQPVLVWEWKDGIGDLQAMILRLNFC